MPDFAIEDRCDGHICGIDEAGRGPLAGPVVAAAVILDRTRVPAGLDDSKKLSAKRRAALFEALARDAEIGVGVAGVAEIERINILNATLAAMARAVAALPRRPAIALVDGNRPPDLPCVVETVVGGDRASLSIAAASIVAKVTRDRLMADLARDYPGYGWDHNAGYGTAEHLAALTRLGVTRHHRRGFAPVRAVLERGLVQGIK